ncbi:MAG: AAA family ATPase [Candidatus Bathyarchaeota archaeon]|nr:MAG: AAA family ATPase [Candidatus Bathyarchaeota archaeon]
MKRIVTMGRGGTGKTTFVALIAKHFIESGITPLLLVDVDPDQNLAEMVGLDLSDEGKYTISELMMETFLEGGGTTVGVPPSERIESRIWEKGLYEGSTFDLIAVGTKFIEGCYCLPDAALKKALENLTKNYEYVLIDSPGGLEHLNRRIMTHVDDIFDVIGPSQKSFKHVERARRIAKEVGIGFNNFYIIAGHRVPTEFEEMVQEQVKQYLGKITYDKEVEDYVFKGKSILELPSSSPAYASARVLLERAGYK